MRYQMRAYFCFHFTDTHYWCVCFVLFCFSVMENKLLANYVSQESLVIYRHCVIHSINDDKVMNYSNHPLSFPETEAFGTIFFPSPLNANLHAVQMQCSYLKVSIYYIELHTNVDNLLKNIMWYLFYV